MLRIRLKAWTMEPDFLGLSSHSTTLNKLLNLSIPQLLQLQNGDDSNNTYFMRLLED